MDIKITAILGLVAINLGCLAAVILDSSTLFSDVAPVMTGATGALGGLVTDSLIKVSKGGK